MAGVLEAGTASADVFFTDLVVPPRPLADVRGVLAAGRAVISSSGGGDDSSELSPSTFAAAALRFWVVGGTGAAALVGVISRRTTLPRLEARLVPFVAAAAPLGGEILSTAGAEVCTNDPSPSSSPPPYAVSPSPLASSILRSSIRRLWFDRTAWGTRCVIPTPTLRRHARSIEPRTTITINDTIPHTFGLHRSGDLFLSKPQVLGTDFWGGPPGAGFKSWSAAAILGSVDFGLRLAIAVELGWLRLRSGPV